jgi:hypothetical protein
VIYTADKTTNDVVFRRIVDLYFTDGWVGIDPTWGRGTFWKQIPGGRFGLTGTDIAKGGPCLTALPYADDSLDFSVLDPPYMDGFFRPKANQTAHPGGDFAARYGNHNGGGYKGLFYQEAVTELYRDGVLEAARVLRHKGVLVVKCQDAVSNHRQHMTHCHIWAAATQAGFRDLDLFVVVRRDKPHGRRIKNQEHARKNHSYFMVFQRWRKA